MAVCWADLMTVNSADLMAANLADLMAVCWADVRQARSTLSGTRLHHQLLFGSIQFRRCVGHGNDFRLPHRRDVVKEGHSDDVIVTWDNPVMCPNETSDRHGYPSLQALATSRSMVRCCRSRQ